MAHDVFISYSTKDKPTADAVCATLERRGIRCWVAPRDILPGMDWGEALIDAIEQSRVMILVFSRNANASPQIKREVERAVSKGLTVVPLRIEDVPMSKSLEYFVSTPHWLDALSPPLERHLVQLADTLRVLLDRSRAAAGESSYARTPPAMPPPMPAATVQVPEWPKVVAGEAAEAVAEENVEAENEADAEAHPEVRVPVVSGAASEPLGYPTTGTSQPPAEAAGSDSEAVSAVVAKPVVPDSPRPAEAASTGSVHGASPYRPPAVPPAPPPAPPPMPGRPPRPTSLRPPPPAEPTAGPFPFLCKWFGPVSPNAQIAIFVGAVLLLLMVLGCFLSGFIGALSSGSRNY